MTKNILWKRSGCFSWTQVHYYKPWRNSREICIVQHQNRIPIHRSNCKLQWRNHNHHFHCMRLDRLELLRRRRLLTHRFRTVAEIMSRPVRGCYTAHMRLHNIWRVWGALYSYHQNSQTQCMMSVRQLLIDIGRCRYRKGHEPTVNNHHQTYRLTNHLKKLDGTYILH